MGEDQAGKRQTPQAQRLKMPKHYEQADGSVPLLNWSNIVNRLEQAENYWLATLSPSQKPHVTPIWGVWVGGAFYFDGIPTARWARNLAANPAIAIHLESGTNVVVLEGLAEDCVTDAEVGKEIISAWTVKYGRLLPEPDTDGIFRLRPQRARGWRDFPHDATCWTFG